MDRDRGERDRDRDRDRDRERDRDRRFRDYRDSSPRGGIDSYVPTTRRRAPSRSPPPRGDSYVPRRRIRSRSPLPPLRTRTRSPPRHPRSVSRSPAPRDRGRSRSPPPSRRRSRTRSPPFRRRRSPISRAPSRSPRDTRFRRRSPSPLQARRDRSKDRSPIFRRDRPRERTPLVRRDRSKERSPGIRLDKSKERSPPPVAPLSARLRTPPLKREKSTSPSRAKGSVQGSASKPRSISRPPNRGRSPRSPRRRSPSPMYRRGRTPRGGGGFGGRRSRSPMRGNDRIYPRRGGDRWGYSPPRARSPPLRRSRSPPTGPRRRRSPTPSLNHTHRTPYRRPSWSRTPPRRQSHSPPRRHASCDSAPKPSPYIPQSRPRSRSPTRNADSRHESPRHLVRHMESSPALSGGVHSRGQVSPVTHSAPRSPPSRARSPPRGPRNGISPQPPINGSAIHPDRLQQLASSTNGFSSTPPRGPAGNGRPPPMQPRGGGHVGYGAPRVQPSIPLPNTTRTPIPQRNGVPLGPRRGSTATGASGTPPPTIPTGPRAGNFPYRSTIPTPAPVRYAPAPSGPGATIPGGRLLPVFDKASEERLARLRADQAKLEEDVKILQERKRKGLYQWEKTKREAEKEGFRAEIAEQYLLGDVMME